MLTENENKKGSLEVICGPMFSGKSEELIRRLKRAQIAKQKVLTCKHSLDNRYMIECIISHDGNKLEAEAIENVDDIMRLGKNKDIEVIGIDEVQWFNSKIVTIICDLIESGKRIIVAGYELDFRAKPVGPMPILLSIADKVTKLQAICSICGKDANLTQRLVNNKPAKYTDPDIVVGGLEGYQARCRNCHEIDSPQPWHIEKKTNKNAQNNT
ncbi:thymidine kinase [Candidatus Dependentiae bacterium]